MDIDRRVGDKSTQAAAQSKSSLQTDWTNSDRKRCNFQWVQESCCFPECSRESTQSPALPLKEIWPGSPSSAVRLTETIKQNIAESFFRIWEGFVAADLG